MLTFTIGIRECIKQLSVQTALESAEKLGGLTVIMSVRVSEFC